MPDPARFTDGQHVSVTGIETGMVTLDLTRHDPVDQRLYCQHVTLTESGPRLYPALLLYAWPSELDLMARSAGLRLRERWSDWSRARFTNRVTAEVVAATDAKTLQGFIADHAAPGATVYTDEAAAYKGMPFAHESVRRGAD